jgi:hypothetical protein
MTVPIKRPSNHGSVQNNVDSPSPRMHIVEARKSALVVESSITGMDDH